MREKSEEGKRRVSVEVRIVVMSCFPSVRLGWGWVCWVRWVEGDRGMEMRRWNEDGGICTQGWRSYAL